MIPVLYRGSVKDVLGPVDHGGESCLWFEFSDAYSVFDWGRMPDLVPGKGQALCVIAAHLFEVFEKAFATHYLGVVEGDHDRPHRLNECSRTPRRLAVRSIGGARAAVRSDLRFIPLEVIFRLGFPRGSSAIGRIPGAREGEKCSEPWIEFSTKLEDQDRLLTEAEAATVAGLSVSQVESLKQVATKLSRVAAAEFRRVGVDLWDGKFEFAVAPDGKYVLVDSVGPDELRLSRGGAELSKEVLRTFYRGTRWFDELKAAKASGGAWRSAVGEPPRLPDDVLRQFAATYTDLAEQLTGRKWTWGGA